MLHYEGSHLLRLVGIVPINYSLYPLFPESFSEWKAKFMSQSSALRKSGFFPSDLCLEISNVKLLVFICLY